ncbi:MAG TPA: dTDP-4-dehydrorhamnose reductase [Thermodesulfovibrionales bacterium]|nr:dTDP-4-dehydrorhamnose reductase [Thermodesulfovibrionales bacterium]
MKILVTGSKGMLAHDLIPLLRESHEVAAFDLDLDITVRRDVSEAVRRIAPDRVINCAAYTQVDKAEEEREKAFLVNGLGVQNLALACAEGGIPLCQVSTDYVFDGEKETPYTPFDNTNPISVYGESKLAGERYAEWILSRFYIIRTSWLYGKGGKNFVETIRRIARERPEIRVVDDQRGSPTSTVSLSRAIKSLIETNAYGIHHFTDRTDGGISWFDFAGEIVRVSGLPARVLPIKTEEYPLPARRPKYSVLDLSLFPAAAGFEPVDWKAALRDYLAT